MPWKPFTLWTRLVPLRPLTPLVPLIPFVPSFPFTCSRRRPSTPGLRYVGKTSLTWSANTSVSKQEENDEQVLGNRTDDTNSRKLVGKKGSKAERSKNSRQNGALSTDAMTVRSS